MVTAIRTGSWREYRPDDTESTLNKYSVFLHVKGLFAIKIKQGENSEALRMFPQDLYRLRKEMVPAGLSIGVQNSAGHLERFLAHSNQLPASSKTAPIVIMEGTDDRRIQSCSSERESARVAAGINRHSTLGRRGPGVIAQVNRTEHVTVVNPTKPRATSNGHPVLILSREASGRDRNHTEMAVTTLRVGNAILLFLLL